MVAEARVEEALRGQLMIVLVTNVRTSAYHVVVTMLIVPAWHTSKGKSQHTTQRLLPRKVFGGVPSAACHLVPFRYSVWYIHPSLKTKTFPFQKDRFDIQPCPTNLSRRPSKNFGLPTSTKVRVQHHSKDTKVSGRGGSPHGQNMAAILPRGAGNPGVPRCTPGQAQRLSPAASTRSPPNAPWCWT